MTWKDDPIIDIIGKPIPNVLLELYNEYTPDGFMESYGINGGILRHMEARDRLVREYAWAVPTKTALQHILRHSPIVEMGAGIGYWAYLIRAMGGDIIAYDKWTNNKNAFGINMWHSPRKEFTRIDHGDPKILAEHSDRTLFLCWPPYNDPMAADCLKYWKGKTLIHVGENGRATADAEFFQILEESFSQTMQLKIPQWLGIHDAFTIWVRK